MPLVSRLFSVDRKLQACLTSHSAHVVPGDRGDHVARIQSALVRLRVLKPADARVEAGYFGTRTAAVLFYKQSLKIINRRYQTKADNIVGKMTIASLDRAVFVLDGSGGVPRRPQRVGPHPKSPKVIAPSAGAAKPSVPSGSAKVPSPIQSSPVKPSPGKTANPAKPAGSTSAPPAPSSAAGVFVPPLSDLPADIQEVVRRSNAAKKPDELMLFPFIGKAEGPLSPAVLSARFGGANASATAKLVELHSRMRPFGIWQNIKIIINVYQGTGSRGIFCEPFNHGRFLAQMIALTTGPVIGPSISPLTDSKFCRDRFNVHGPRDSFREIVSQGPGLHICIAQPPVRASTSCDLHIDDVQQGQVCAGGFCVPLINGQTIDHLRTVAPWLADEAKKWLPKFMQ